MTTNTYVALDKVTVGTATSTITFSSISGAYTDLIIVGNWGQSSDSESCLFRVGNGSIDSGTNYSATELYGTGSTAGSQRTTNANGARITFATGGGSSVTSNFQLNLMNYANTTTNKSFLTRYNVPSSAYPGTGMFASLWRSTVAINTVQLYLTGGNFVVGSTFSLYGIKAWTPEDTPKAVGGYVSSDSTYWYHAFPFSSTFVPNQSLTADVLVVAGGGSALVGGGGAGGLRAITGVSCTAQTYTVTVGAGGVNPRTYPYYPSNNGNHSSALGYNANGGGGSGLTDSTPKNGYSGGSGGGGAGDGAAAPNAGGVGNAGVFTPVEGYSGGASVSTAAPYVGGGGGGAGGVGQTAPAYNRPGNGGIGATSALINAMGAATLTGELSGENYYYAGGGAGGSADSLAGNPTKAVGGLGGGGSTAASTTTNGGNGLVSTGGGGGARWGNAAGASHGGNGGSGIVIIRYAKA
jgi:hypothetical protein